MNLTIKATGVDLTDSLRSYVESKMSALRKFLPSKNREVMANMEIGRTSMHHRGGGVFKAEININQPGERLIREVVMEDDIYTAIDVLQQKVTGTLGQHKDKSRHLFKRGARAVKNILRGFSK